MSTTDFYSVILVISEFSVEIYHRLSLFSTEYQIFSHKKNTRNKKIKVPSPMFLK